MKYLIMLYGNPEFQAVWDEWSEAQRAEAVRFHAQLDEDLAASGELVVSEALADPTQGKRVSVRNGGTTATDGPFPEVKEHLAGFYLVDCESMDRAVEYAARLPEATYGMVEVRPILDLGTLGL
ncbi:Uncharacterized conserved protein [Amycolatopsis arida]|uniref:Uncharacterized conserved protein n=1 Tax=Amycolatopsis arida TaxID=587909 RepID=A0A1I5TTZ3_9PSEU|nr:YciI family protein [Amycolatopsis arida]TDX95973.1 hypothetical protein CLV69_103107 [Amycolatopsis arida]SFP86371.1 Uncharacterized conserved protein [Amycolatopsis arida]